MSTRSHPRPEVVQAIREITERNLGAVGFELIRIDAANDHDGDPVLLLEVQYRAANGPVDFEALARFEETIRERLLLLDEDRFPHVRYREADDRRAAG